MAVCKNCHEGTVNNEGEICRKCKRKGVSFSTSSSQIEKEKLETIELAEESEEETTASADGLNEEIFRQLAELDGWHLSLSTEINKVEEQIKNLSGLINDKISLTISQRWVEIAEKAVESKIKDANGKLEVKILPSLGLLENEVKNLSRNLLSQSLSRPPSSSSPKIDLTELKKEIEDAKDSVKRSIKFSENGIGIEILKSEGRITESTKADLLKEINALKSKMEEKIDSIVKKVIEKELESFFDEIFSNNLSKKVKNTLSFDINSINKELLKIRNEVGTIEVRSGHIRDDLTKVRKKQDDQTQAIRDIEWNIPSNFWNVVNFFLIIGGFITFYFFRKKKEEPEPTLLQKKHPKEVSFW